MPKVDASGSSRADSSTSGGKGRGGGSGKNSKHATAAAAPTVETATFRCFQAGYCSLEKYASSVDNVCEQVVAFLREFNVAVQNIGLCVLATGCFAFVEFHRLATADDGAAAGAEVVGKRDGGGRGDENDAGGGGSAGEEAATIESSSGFNVAPGPSDRFGPWTFTHTFRKRVLGGARRDDVPTLISSVMADAAARNQARQQHRLVTFSSVLLSEVGCHAVRARGACASALWWWWWWWWGARRVVWSGTAEIWFGSSCLRWCDAAKRDEAPFRHCHTPPHGSALAAHARSGVAGSLRHLQRRRRR